MRRILLGFAAACIAVMLFSSVSSATQAVGINISDMMKTAEIVATATCTGKDPHIKDGLLVTTWTFSVNVPEDVYKAPDGYFKGTGPQPLVFTQWGAPKEDAKKLGMPMPSDRPAYQIGTTYVLALGAESSLGLKATVGLWQGTFNIIDGPDGTKQVVNGSGNKALFINPGKAMTKAMSASGVSGKSGPIDYTSFQNLLKQINKEQGATNN